MKLPEHPSWLGCGCGCGCDAARRFTRQPYLLLSALAHAGLLMLSYYLGSYAPQMRVQRADVDSSLRATDMATATKRLQTLETIKKLFEKSADAGSARRVEPNLAPPDTPESLVKRARELSRSIDALDEERRADELEKLLGRREVETRSAMPPPDAALATEAAGPEDTSVPPDGAQLTAHMAAIEIAALEAKAREALVRHQARSDAKANGVRVEAESTGSMQVEGSGSAADIVGSGDLVVPPVDASTLVLGQGRMFGVGGQYANRVYLDTWYIIGPFAGGSRGRQPDSSAYPPENAVLLDAVYLGMDERLVRWRYVSSQTYPLQPPDVAEDAVYYGYTEVSVDRDCDLTAWIGADDNAQIYLNDRRVWGGGTVSLMRYLYAIWEPRTTHLRDYNLTEARRLLHFSKGRNKLFFKLSNGFQGTHLSLVLTRDRSCG